MVVLEPTLKPVKGTLKVSHVDNVCNERPKRRILVTHQERYHLPENTLYLFIRAFLSQPFLRYSLDRGMYETPPHG
jgi:hypothetical protein